MTNIERVAPQDRSAEVALLGGLLLDNKYVPKVSSIVQVFDFYEKANQIIFGVIVELFKENVIADLVTVTDKLVALGQINAVGGRSYLVELTEEVYSAVNCERYAEIVKEKSLLRKLMLLSADAFTKAQRMEGDVKELLTEVAFSLEEIASQRYENLVWFSSGKSVILPSGYAVRRQEEIDKYKELERVVSGFRTLDKHLTYGFAPGLISMIASRPGIGKSALKARLIINLCNRGHVVGSISTEQTILVEQNRFDSIMLRMPLTDIIRMRSWGDSDERFQQLKENAQFIAKNWKYYLVEGFGMTVPDVARTIEGICKKEGRCNIVFIDLFDRLVDVNLESPAQVKRKLSDLDSVGKEFGTHICLLAQIRRLDRSGKRSDLYPRLEGMKWAGAFEEVGRLVLLLHREAFYRKDVIDNEIEVIIAKQNDGKAGEFFIHKLGFDPEYVSVFDLDEPEQEIGVPKEVEQNQDDTVSFDELLGDS